MLWDTIRLCCGCLAVLCVAFAAAFWAVKKLPNWRVRRWLEKPLRDHHTRVALLSVPLLMVHANSQLRSWLGIAIFFSLVAGFFHGWVFLVFLRPGPPPSPPLCPP